MKRSILLFTAVAGIFYLTLSSYQNGPAVPGGLGNRTGSSGGTPTCGDNGCHGGTNVLNTMSLGLTDSATAQQGSGYYVGGHTYNVVMTISTTNPGVTKYGYQATIVKAVNQQAGTITAPNPNVQHTFTVGSGSTQITGVEHSTPVQSSGQLTPISFKWKAPAVGTGTVKLYAIVNAVNGDGVQNAADHATSFQIDLHEWPASVSELSKEIKITAYPNPVSNKLNLKFDDAENGDYSIAVIDVTGRKVYSDKISVSGGQASASVDATGWANGLYFAQVTKDGAQRMMAVSKQ